MSASTTVEIPGINVAVALRQLGNNMKLYMKLLDQFQKSYAETGQEIAASIASGDMETAERSAHTIKGLAGSLGATNLQEAAKDLEKLCRDRADSSLLTDPLAIFSRELAETIGAIRAHLEAAAAPAPAVANQANTTLLSSQLASLAAYVQDSDARALMLFDEMRPNLAAYDQSLANRLATAFELFDFAAAAEAIATARARLG